TSAVTTRRSDGTITWASPAMFSAALAVAVPATSLAAAFAPTHTSTAPGSTMRVIDRSLKANRCVGTENDNVADSPAASVTGWNPRSCTTGLVTDAVTSRP